MEVRDVDPDDLRDLLERAREQGYTKEEIVDETNRYADLKALVEDAERNNPQRHRTVKTLRDV